MSGKGYDFHAPEAGSIPRNTYSSLKHHKNWTWSLESGESPENCWMCPKAKIIMIIIIIIIIIKVEEIQCDWQQYHKVILGNEFSIVPKYLSEMHFKNMWQLMLLYQC